MYQARLAFAQFGQTAFNFGARKAAGSERGIGVALQPLIKGDSEANDPKVRWLHLDHAEERVLRFCEFP